MSQLRKVIILLTLIVCMWPAAGLASDILSRLTHNGQYALVLGTITAISGSAAEFQVEAVISGNAIPDTLRIEIPDRYLNGTNPTIMPNDFVVLSLDRDGEEYSIAYGIYKVSSLNMKTLEVLEGPLWRGDLAALEWYINSGGTENDFYFINTTAYVRNADGTSTQIYPQVNEGASPASEKTVGQDSGAQEQTGEQINSTATPVLSLSQDNATAATNTGRSDQEQNAAQADQIFQSSPILTGIAMITLLGLCWVLFYKLKAG